MSDYVDPTQYDVIPKQWKVTDHPVLGKVVAAMLPYPTLDAGAACAGDPDWTDSRAMANSVKRGRMLMACADCPIRRACLEYGIAHEDHGIWGGTVPDERRRVRKARRQLLVEPQRAHEYELTDDYFAFLNPGGEHLQEYWRERRAESEAD